MKNLQKSNFTIVELLVVIAIITVLCSLLLPAFSSGLNRAKLNTCRNNLHSIGIGINLYANENELFIPNIMINMEKSSIPLLRLPNSEVVALGRLLKGYIESAHTFGCPDSPGFRENDVAAAWSRTPMVWSGYLYRSQAAGYQAILTEQDNLHKALVIDFACIKSSGNITPHQLQMSNLLFSDAHVESRTNSPEPFELYTARAERHGEMIPDCTLIWQNADNYAE